MIVWSGEPAFPETDLNAGEKRVRVGGYWVDCREDENPTDADVALILNPVVEGAPT